MTNSNAARVWTKHYRNGFGSADRIQRNYYAYLVAMVMTGGRHACPSCDGILDLNRGAEVDRIHGRERDENGSEVYREGSVVYLCKGCNAARGELQSLGRDWPHVDQYINDVESASAHVTVPSIREAREWWQDRPDTSAPVSRYA